MSWMSSVTRSGRLRGGGAAMDVSPGKFLLCFFGLSFVGWLILKFAATVLAWIFSRIFGGPVQFRFAGFNCLRDVSLKFKKGAVESIAIGEIKLSFRKSLVKLGQSMISRDPKLQLLLSDLEVVIRHPQRRKHTSGTLRTRSASRGKWMLITNTIKYLSVNVTELIVKIPKVTCEVKELKLDIFKDRASSSSLGVKLQLLPCNIFLGKQHICEHDDSFSLKESILSVGRTLSANIDKNYAPFYLEELLVICQFGFSREGVTIKHVEGTCGEVLVNLSEDEFNSRKPSKERTEDGNVSKDLDPEYTEKLESHIMPEEKESFRMSSAEKYMLALPEKVSFSLPKLSMNCFFSEGLRVQNNIMGIHLWSTRSKIPEEMGDSISHLDIQIDCSEIHCVKEGNTSILEILKVVVSTSFDIPRQLTMPFRAEIDIKLGGTQCNLLINRLKLWMDLYLKHKRKRKLSTVQSGGKPHMAKPSFTDLKSIMWTCTVSAPETTVILYNLNDAPIYLGCSQSSHLFVNNITSEKISVHMELGELHLHVADEDHGCLKESLFAVETNSESLLHVSRVSVDWGLRETESLEDDKTEQRKLTLAVEVSGSSACLSLQRLQLLVFTVMSYAAVLKSVSAINNRAKKRKGNTDSKLGAKGTNVIRLNLEKFTVKFVGDLNVENTDIADPKRVNFGSQGGEVIITEVEEGKARMANVKSSCSNGTGLELKCITSLNIVDLALCRDKDTNVTQVELERGKIMYQEVAGDRSFADLTLLSLQNGKVVYQAPNNNGITGCFLVCATDVTIRWEPDVHLVLYETMLHLKSLLQEQRNLSRVYIADTFSFNIDEDFLYRGTRRSTVSDFQGSVQNDKQHHKELVLAVDIEQLTLSAGLADGVECLIKVQSIFSEDAKIGMLLEDLELSLNEATVFKSNRLQISRIPSSEGGTETGSCFDTGIRSSVIWDCIIQGRDIHIIMPHRLQLRAIEDAVEDMYRALKLVMAAKRPSLCPSSKKSSKHSKNSLSKIGCIKFNFHEVIAEIEEEPIQGWLDEHYQLMKNEVCELSARLRFLDEIVADGSSFSGIPDLKEFHTENYVNLHEKAETNISNHSSAKILQERLQQQAFQSYYKACQKLVISEGSGACRNGLQAGFRPSVGRSFLLSIRASNLELTLTEIEGGKVGMLEILRKLDCISPEMEIPFSRVMGRNVSINTGSLVVQLRNYSFPMLAATVGKCNGSIILAQQATTFPPQIFQDVYIGRWHKVEMLRSLSGTTPPLKMYSELPIQFEKAEVAYGVGFEPAIADLSYAFTVALRKANLSVRSNAGLPSGNIPGSVLFPSRSHIRTDNQTAKKERSLPWWDDMRYYIHGRNGIRCSDFKWIFLATTDPYEKIDKLQIVSTIMDIQQSEGRLSFYAKEFNIFISSLEHLLKNYNLKLPTEVRGSFISSAAFQLDITMDWECESGNPLNHYLHALPSEFEPRKKVYDPFRSTSLSLRWNFSLKPSSPIEPMEEVSSSTGDADRLSSNVKTQVVFAARKTNTNRNSYDSASNFPPGKLDIASMGVPTANLGAHDLIWIFRWWNLYYNPPHKIRSFSKWPRFGIPRLLRSGNLSLDKVMTEFMLRVDATPTCINHVPLGSDDPANGLAFDMKKLKYELCYSRGRQLYTSDCKRDPLDQVYQGLELHLLKAELKDSSTSCIEECSQNSKRVKQPTGLTDSVGNEQRRESGVTADMPNGDVLLLYTDYFTIRKQSPNVDPERLISWQEEGRSTRSLEATYVRSEFDYGSENDATLSDPSDDDGYNVVLADNCQRVFVYGLKLLWTIKNRDAVWAWVGEIAKAFESPKPSPSRQYAQRKMIEEQQKLVGTGFPFDDPSRCSTSPKQSKGSHVSSSPIHADKPISSPSPSRKTGCASSATAALLKGLTINETGEEGIMNFMVNVIQPQFNLHSEEANGAFLLAAASGRVLARSFHSVLHVGFEMIEQALVAGGIHIPGSAPEMTWKRRELSVMLEHVQAHVAPTDVDPGAGLQWLPKIPRSSPEVKRTGALLERVFMPCTMYFRYTRHKGGTADLKMKPLKELSFNSPNITATMTSRQFHVMVDILSNLLLARLPKPRKSSLLHPGDEEEGIEEETDEVVPDGVEEVELARVKLEQAERECKLLLDDVRAIAVHGGFLSLTETDFSPEKEDTLWMMSCGKSALVQNLKKELSNKRKARKAASALLRLALQRAAQQRLMDKEKNKSPSFAMRISWAIDKVVWSMLADGKAFAEAEISQMMLNVDRDYKDVGVAEFVTRSFVVRNCLANAKSDVVLSAWNPPTEWGRNRMLLVDAKQGAPKDGNSPLERFQVEIYPLRIYLTETMYKMMWEYFFPEEEQDSQKRQEGWKVSTTAGTKRGKRGLSSNNEQASTSSYRAKEIDTLTRGSAPGTPLVPLGDKHPLTLGDPSQLNFLMAAQVLESSRLQNQKTTPVTGPGAKHRRTSSFDRTWEENVVESVANELVSHAQVPKMHGSNSGPLSTRIEHPSAIRTSATAVPLSNVDVSKNRSRETKTIKAGRYSHEEKKPNKSHEEKKVSRARKALEFQNIKISQVELLVTYEGSRLAFNDLRLLMDTFTLVDYTGTWRRLFGRVRKHIIWGVLKSVTGMQGKKFKDKVQGQKQADGGASPDSDLNFSDSDGSQPGKNDQFPITWFKRPSDRAGEGFVTSIRGLFNSQRRKAKAFVLRTMRGDAENEFQGEWSESDTEFSPFARQLTMTRAKRLIRRHTKKFRSNRHKALPFLRDSFHSSPRTTPFQSEADSSSVSSAYEDFHD